MWRQCGEGGVCGAAAMSVVVVCVVRQGEQPLFELHRVHAQETGGEHEQL